MHSQACKHLTPLNGDFYPCVNPVAMAANMKLFIYVNKHVCEWDMKNKINRAILNEQSRVVLLWNILLSSSIASSMLDWVLNFINNVCFVPRLNCESVGLFGNKSMPLKAFRTWLHANQEGRLCSNRLQKWAGKTIEISS